MRRIADWIIRVLDAPDDSSLTRGVRGAVGELCDAFPLYEEFGTLV
jgi:glycine/serine hydroxymethyltransferase